MYSTESDIGICRFSLCQRKENTGTSNKKNKLGKLLKLFKNYNLIFRIFNKYIRTMHNTIHNPLYITDILLAPPIRAGSSPGISES